MNTDERIKKVISEQLNIDVDSFNEGSPIIELGADSLDTVEIIMALEEEFNLNLQDEKIKIVNVGDIIRYIKNALAKVTAD